MSRKMISFFFLFGLCAISALPAPISVINPKPGVPIRFDAKNGIIYDKPAKGNYALHLHYQIDETTRTWVIDPFFPEGRPWLSEIHYADSNHVWLVTDLFQIKGAHLLDLGRQKILKSFAVNWKLAISPDGQRLAYSLEFNHRPMPNECMVIDGLAVYPVAMKMGEYSKKSPSEFSLDDSALIVQREFNNKKKIYSEIQSIHWIGNDELEFIVEENPQAPRPKYYLPGKFYKCTVTGLSEEKSDPGRIKLTRKEISKVEAEAASKNK